MKKKILGIVLSLTMVGAMLAGCGQQQGAEDKKEETKKEETKTEDTNTDKADDTDKQDDKTDESKTEGTGKFAPVAKEDLKVGVIHISDPAEGSGYTYTHDQGIVEMQQEQYSGYRSYKDGTGYQRMYRGWMPDHFCHQL